MYRNMDCNWMKLLREKRVIVFGCGVMGKRYANSLLKSDINVYGAYDNNPELWNKKFLDLELPIFTKERFVIEAKKEDSFIVITSSYASQIVEQLILENIFNFVNGMDIDLPLCENYYDDVFFEWQKKIGSFGGKHSRSIFEPYINSNEAVLDFGCGGGYLLKELPNIEKYGVEVNPAAIEECKSLKIKCYAQIEDIENETMDKIISSHALEHVENPLEILRKLYLKLKWGGSVIFQVPYEYGVDFEYRKSDINNHLYTWHPLALGNLFKAAGFYIREIKVLDGVWPENYEEIMNQYGEELFRVIEYLYGKVNQRKSILIVAEK